MSEQYKFLHKFTGVELCAIKLKVTMGLVCKSLDGTDLVQ